MEPILFRDSPDFTDIAEDGFTDLRGRPVSRLLTGGWSASLLIIGVEMTERLAYFGVSANLVIYLTNIMQQSTASAAKNVNVWYGVASMLPLLGAFLADSYLGRYWTILFSSLIYLLGLICLTLSACLPFFRPPPCEHTSYSCPRPASFQVVFFFISLYLVALGQGGHRPCLQAFGADQFDERHPKESKSKSSFFNWWYFGLCSGLFVLVPVIVYIQENVEWGLGFALPAAAMAIALSLFLFGTKIFRHKIPCTSPVTQIVQVFVAAICKWNVSGHFQEGYLYGIQGLKDEKRRLLPSNQFRFLDKATIATDWDHENKTNIDWRVCTAAQVEEVKLVLRLTPIWMTCLIYGVICAQTPTFFTKQGSTMDRRIIGDFKIPAANLQSLISLTVLVLVPVYDRIFVPLARSISGNERGITLLQRIGFGMFISVISMIVAAMTEMKRLQAAREYGLIDLPQLTIPLSILWLLPQYILFGVSDVFTYLGLQEFFYDQMPDSMRSLGVALYLSIFGVGSFLSSILISIIEEMNSRVMGQNWFTDNLNRAHLDYFYWLLAALNALFLCIYISFARSFIYKQEERNVWKDEEIS